MKKLLPILLAFLSVCFHASSQTCTLADLQVSNITITNVSGNSFTYTYTIRNAGGATLYLNRFYFQAYVSQNSIYDTTDQPAGGSIFSNATIVLAPGQTYTGTWTSNPFVSITTYPYLIFRVQLRSGYSQAECSLTNNNYTRYIGCNQADLDITAINITNVSGNSLSYNFVLKNLGWAPLPLSKMYFQAWVSTDAILDASDKPAGGSIFGATAPTLGKDGLFTRASSSSPGVSLYTYKYLIIEVREISANTVPDCNKVNNVQAKLIGCNLSDLDVTTININSIAGNSFNFTFTVKNLGWASLPLSSMYFQAWVSTDASLDITDKPAGGSIFGTTAPTLIKDGTYTRSWTSNPTVSIATYKYLIIEVRVRPGYSVPECNTINNVQARLIYVLSTATASEEEAKTSNLRAIYNGQEGSLSLNSEDLQEVSYKVFKLDGSVVGELHQGTFTGSYQIAMPSLAPGLYIVNMSNGKESLSEKFVVTP